MCLIYGEKRMGTGNKNELDRCSNSMPHLNYCNMEILLPPNYPCLS